MVQTILQTIQDFGVGLFIAVLIIDILLWQIHPVLGILSVLFTFAFLVGLI